MLYTNVCVLCRDALHARSAGAGTSYGGDQSQVSINMPDAFDLDSEVEGLQGQVGRLKQVQPECCQCLFKA